MTKRDKNLVILAIDKLMADGNDFHGGMEILDVELSAQEPPK